MPACMPVLQLLLEALHRCVAPLYHFVIYNWWLALINCFFPPLCMSGIVLLKCCFVPPTIQRLSTCSRLAPSWRSFTRCGHCSLEAVKLMNWSRFPVYWAHRRLQHGPRGCVLPQQWNSGALLLPSTQLVLCPDVANLAPLLLSWDMCAVMFQWPYAAMYKGRLGMQIICSNVCA